MKILIVDDEPFMRLLLKDYLSDAGYEDVVMVNSADKSFEMLGMDGNKKVDGADEIDCILMDIAMVGTDGIEACRKIKSDPKYHDVPIVMVTSMEDESLVKSALDAGAIEYIKKPVNSVELVARINAMGKLKKQLDGHKDKEKRLEELSTQLQELNDKLKESNVELKKHSHIDLVAGIASKFRFEEHFFVEWRRAIRYKSNLSIMLLNIDFFDSYNKEYGREAGDECLKRMGKDLTSDLHRPADLVARYGGGEFVAMLPDTDLKGAMIVAETSKKSIKDLKIKHSKSSVSEFLTVSMAIVTTIPTPKMRPYAIIEAAKTSLKAAKDKGGNNVQSHVYKGDSK